MKISEVIYYLIKLKEAKGDIPISMDFRYNEKALAYNEDLECVFGDYGEPEDF